MIYLFTDYGVNGPYLGLLEAAVRREAPGCPVINLMADAPAMDPLRSSYLLSALEGELAPASIVVAVVDPGVGGDRAPVTLEAGGRWYVGPDNGLLDGIAARHGANAHWRRIDWTPERLSSSFHGRDLFAPIAGRLARGDEAWASRPHHPSRGSNRTEDLFEVIYLDGFGNAMTGVRYRSEFKGKRLRLGSHRLPYATTFCEVDEGQVFWFKNSLGLVEIAARGGAAGSALAQIRLGAAVDFGDELSVP